MHYVIQLSLEYFIRICYTVTGHLHIISVEPAAVYIYSSKEKSL